MPPEHQIIVTTMYGLETRQPYVSLAWGAERGDLTPDEARTFALQVLDAASASEADAFLVEFLNENVGANLEHAAHLLNEFREWREKRTS